MKYRIAFLFERTHRAEVSVEKRRYDISLTQELDYVVGTLVYTTFHSIARNRTAESYSICLIKFLCLYCFRAYPPLRHSGGFEFLLCKEESRKQLRVVNHGSCSAEQLRCFGTGRIYVRPLQRSIPITNVAAIKMELEECLTCFLPIPVNQMREHHTSCSVSTKYLHDMCLRLRRIDSRLSNY